jgi:Cu+-exporting ATPase
LRQFERPPSSAVAAAARRRLEARRSLLRGLLPAPARRAGPLRRLHRRRPGRAAEALERAKQPPAARGRSRSRGRRRCFTARQHRGLARGGLGVGVALARRAGPAAAPGHRRRQLGANVQHAAAAGISPPPVSSFFSTPGAGVSGISSDSRQLLAGRRSWLQSLNISIPPELDAAAASTANSPDSIVWFASNNSASGWISIADPLKPSAPAAIAALKSLGISTIMLTGDRPESAAAVARATGISDFRPSLLPEDKLRIIRECQASGSIVAMAGDGINDAPALAAADSSIAMGTGTDVAMHSAGLVLVKGDLAALVRAVHLSRATLRNIKQNLFWAFAYNSLGLPLAAGVFYPFTGWLLHPMFAGVAMSLSSITVVTNALRLRHVKL